MEAEDLSPSETSELAEIKFVRSSDLSQHSCISYIVSSLLSWTVYGFSLQVSHISVCAELNLKLNVYKNHGFKLKINNS